MVIDFKNLNVVTITDKYPIPVVITNLGKAKYFSTIDLESEFYQILMEENNIAKTTFAVNNVKLRMPLGLKNGPRTEENTLKKYVTFTSTISFSESITDHIKNLKIIIETLQEVDMKFIEQIKIFLKNKHNFQDT